MAKEEKKAPKLRFNGYTNDWERKKLGIYVPITMGQSPNSKNYTNNPRDNILVQGNADLYNNRVLKRTFTTEVTKIADRNDILISVRAPVGDIARNQYESIVIGRGIAAIKGNNFLYYQLEKMNNSGFWKKYIAGSTFESITGKDLKSSDIYISNHKEEKSIGDIFQTLTKTIQLHERKCEELTLIKQALLQKLFPKKDEIKPEVRYENFSDAWEQRKLGDYLSIPTKEPITDINELKLMTLKLNLEGITLTANRETLKLGATKYYKRHEGQLLYGKQNFFHGSIALISKEAEGYATSGDVPALDISNVNGKYLVDYISRPSYFKAKEALATGTGSKRIHEKTLLNFKITVPSLEEQNAISDFITNYTNLITLHQCKLEKLKQLKKFLLQNMFI